MSDIDQQFIEYVVKSLVGKPDAVHIERRIDEKGVLLELTVDPEDLGRVIGKRGATAQSLRTLLRALGTKNDARYNLKIIDNGMPPQAASSTDDTKAEPPKKADEVAAEDTPQDEQPVEDIALKDEPEVETAEDTIPKDEPKVGTTDDKATSDRLAQAREELADLDDLDI